MHDLIGDIHGHASVLKRLLEKLGYIKKAGAYRHPVRTVIFVGDYIDRGPKIPETLAIVRSMVEDGQAIALMCNHEFNAICYNQPDGEGGSLREHSPKNNTQHREALRQFRGRRDEYEEYINWFKTLPIYFENGSLCAIHACWKNNLVHQLEPFINGAILQDQYLQEAGDRQTRLYKILDDLLKGIEVELPNGESFKDKDGHKRTETRIKWWLNPARVSFNEWSFSTLEGMNGEHALTQDGIDDWYPKDAKPIFFGHYWLHGRPSIQRSNVCCLDYSIGKKDKLVAYRFDGEEELSDNQLVWIDYREAFAG